ncbi:MAG TPA: alkyl sulfatase dimerization domain-containing protein [Thermoleophilaceae bacterium]|nr:alkyl sulfatase dimerization domain-containing protein [Thermoleophilaceae bacterium]
MAASLPLDDRREAELATRGRIAPLAGPVVRADGATAWDPAGGAFLSADCPPEVNPSLWRHARLDAEHGLFEVHEGIYQVRGGDISNVTFVAGESGWVVVDSLTSAETARAARALVAEHVGDRPVRAVIYTHSHIDHFGGIRGILSDEELASGVRIIAPEGFLDAAVSENVIAGPAMARRAEYMFGGLLPRGPRGHVDAGIGVTISNGSPGLIAPTESITETGTVLEIDGLTVEFQLTPNTEAPAEMNFLFVEQRALCVAENCSATMHNLYTPRGAEVRDALGWSSYITEAIERFRGRFDLTFACHHWPRWGEEEALDYLAKQRDLYRYIHDQTIRLANSGLTMEEAAEALDVPESLQDEFSCRGYYGTVNHNVKAVYQRYLGWFDGNPAHLHPHPPVEAGRRYVDYMGGADAVLARARASYSEGDYRWVAEVVNHVVFADPDNAEARELQADALEQLGYQAESGPWRAFYLTGALELRQGVAKGDNPVTNVGVDLLGALTAEMVLHVLGVRIDGPRADGRSVELDVEFTDTGETFALTVAHGALSHPRGPRPAARTTVRAARLAFLAIVGGVVSPADAVASGAIEIEGDAAVLDELVSLLEAPAGRFPIVTP